MDNLAQIIIPPEMSGVILAIVERWRFVMYESIASYLYGVTQEWQVDVCASINGKGTGIYSGESYLAHYIIVKGLALGLAQLTAYAQRMLIELLESAFFIRQFVVAEVIAGESFQTSLCPLAESFERSHCHGVLDAPVSGLIVDRIACKLAGIVVLLEIVVLWSLVSLVDTLVVIKLHGVDEAGYRNIFCLVEE